ncbi:MAG: sugar phosphate isomerase/epimerase [Planctomycetes bacterium]|nr:sugar phosphate isomerase/epimerase [Planctomycetota bacterium]
MPLPISIQLYTVREQMKDGNHAAVLKRIADIGYTAVEGGPGYGLDAKGFRALVESLGMRISSTHGAKPTAENVQQLIDTAKDLGCAYTICSYRPEDFADADTTRRLGERLAPLVERMTAAGVTFCLHNHWWEFIRLGGRLPYEHLLETCPKMQLQIDTYWACNFGAEVPAQMVSQFKSRTPLLHLKDGSFVKGEPMVACGSGKQDFPTVVAAADPKLLTWLIVELDECAGDMLQAVADSYVYLVGMGLASGTKPAQRARNAT